MTNWMSLETLTANGAVFTKILTVILGMYTWECVITLWYDIDVVTGRRPFKWPMIIYWITKYSMFWANIGLAIANNVTGELNCQSLYVFNQLVGNTAVGGASTLLMLRVIAIWSAKIYIVIPLVVMSLGQWAILLHSVATLSVHYIPAAGGCVVTDAPHVFLQLLYIYTMAFDLLVLVLSTIGLLRLPGRSGNKASGLWTLLNRDGLFFFIVAFTSNLVAVILILLDLNPIMNVITSVPAAAVSATVACRSFVRLSTYNQNNGAQNSSSGRHRSNSRTNVGSQHMGKKTIGGSPLSYGPGSDNKANTGVHVQMDTFISSTERGHGTSAVSFNDKSDVEAQSLGDKQVTQTHGYGTSDLDFSDEK
ncbi:hypothetical protein FRB96_001822 [Tulasnella sp. 330]|nr:hypothetical protein FRB96_001822 [Tulasnella sp. 330]KAG8885185.1 hypothetical protein FRB97_002003 [Tulasnella sp. 331]KAG8889991.1 hypothetical protein FRB98_001426 [Tulasnella sp. 332]